MTNVCGLVGDGRADDSGVIEKLHDEVIQHETQRKSMEKDIKILSADVAPSTPPPPLPRPPCSLLAQADK